MHETEKEEKIYSRPDATLEARADATSSLSVTPELGVVGEP